MWFVVLQPCQGQPCDCFEHLLVITLSTWAEPLRKKNGAHVLKRGIRIMLLLLGIPPKLISFLIWCSSPSNSSRYAIYIMQTEEDGGLTSCALKRLQKLWNTHQLAHCPN